MKKSLIALAVLGASGFAMAQSSVTLYGVADGGIGKAPGGKTGFVSSHSFTNNGASRVGLKGVEDLGGGLKAGFNFETGLWMGTGNAYGSGINQFWNRNSMVFLGGSWGQFTMGRYYTPGFSAQTGFWELTGAANYTVVGNTYGFGGGNGVWQNNQFRYDAPNFGGLSGMVAYTTKNDNGGTGSKWDLAATYANGPISGALTLNKTQGLKTGWALGGRYNMGNFIVAASYNDRGNVASGVSSRRGISIGGTAIFGAASATLDITRDTKNAAGKRTNFVLEGKYSLSKRTFAYADYLRVDKQNSYTIGVRHNF